MPSQVDKEQSGRLVGGRSARLWRGALTLKPPRGFEGSYRIPAAETTARGLEASAEMPATLASAPHLFQPLIVSGIGGLAEQSVVIDLDTTLAATQRVTPETPITLTINQPRLRDLADTTAGLLAVAYDGAWYYPVGRSDTPDQIQIEWLPESLTEEGAAVSDRSLARIAKLYVYQVVGKPEQTLGLHRARFVRAGATGETVQSNEWTQTLAEGEVRYRKLEPGELQPGQRVALMVHGFGSSTEGIVAELDHLFAQHDLHYDHYLTFDYETLRSGVRSAGTRLADMLREYGFGPQDGIHLDVFAHSLGTLVSRYMVEIAGGRRFVDRVFLAGPPNHGTSLASLKGGLLWLVNLGLNLTGSSLPAMIAGWVLKAVDITTVSLDDLTPGSTIVYDMHNTARTGEVAYHVLAGNNILVPPSSGGWAWLAHQMIRGADAVLDTFFRDQNDLLINVNSMTSLEEVYPPDLWRTKVVSCHHFDYFRTPEATEQLVAWLKAV